MSTLVDVIRDIGLWEFATVASRWLLYIAMAAAIGGASSLHFLKSFTALKKTLLSYTLISTLLALLAAITYFFVRVGAAMEAGVAGMFEPEMVAMLWQSAIGQALLPRILGFLLILLALLLNALTQSRVPETKVELGLLEGLLALIGMALLTLSFTEAGHAVNQSGIFQFTLAIHVLLTAWWMGSLFPLWLVCRKLTFDQAHQALEHFGQLAVAAVLILFSGGLFMSYQLTGWNNLFNNQYGGLLLIKFALVLLILLLAALHKFVLVPQLLHTQDAQQLKKSILLEKILGVSIFAITTLLSTMVGPVH